MKTVTSKENDSVFIMGASGFIGEQVARALLGNHRKVYGLARSQKTVKKLLEIGVIPIEGDIYHPEKWMGTLPPIDYVINVLGFFTDGMPARFSVAHANACQRKYLQWMKTTLELGNRYPLKAIVNVTGTTIFEDMGVGWVTEKTPIRYKRSGFNRVAAPATRLFQQAMQNGVPMVICVAPSVVYGDKPHASFDEVFVKPLARGQMGVVGHGKNYITTGHVEDVGHAIAHLCNAKYAGEIFHISDDQPMTQRQFVTLIANALGKKRVATMPKWLVAILGGKCAAEFMTLSQRIDNGKLKASGFILRYPKFSEKIDQVVESLLCQTNLQPSPPFYPEKTEG